MYRYLIIESKPNKKLDEDVLSVFSEVIDASKIIRSDYQAVLYFESSMDISFEEVVLNVMSDTFLDLRLYVSHVQSSKEDRDLHRLYIQSLMENIPFSKYYYLDDHKIVLYFIHQLNEQMKRFFLQKFYNDQVMIDTIKVYLDSNLNMVNAAKTLYIHRNTLIQRLEKFHFVTGFDIRVFKDAIIVYHLIH